MRIYVAGTFGDQIVLRREAARLWDLGHEVTGSWLLETSRAEHIPSDDFKKKLAVKDITEVVRADLVILDNRQSSGGKNVEWGVGLGHYQHKLLWLVGEPSNVFHYLADKRFNNWDEVIKQLEESYATRVHS
jgi:hypothetical protein